LAIKIVDKNNYWFLPLDFKRKVKPKEYKSPVVAWGRKKNYVTDK